MKYSLLILLFLLSSCARPLYTKDRYFNSDNTEYKIDNNLKELVYKVLQRAVVVEKDIPDYRPIWDKSKIYVSSEAIVYNPNRRSHQLSQNEIPNKIGNVAFSLKTEKELQKIADKSREDFLYLSFSLIKLDGDSAIISINNQWKANKHSKRGALSCGGNTFTYKKVNGKWIIGKKASSWIP